MPLLYDCWFVDSELDLENSHRTQYLENDKFKKTQTKHNVPAQEAGCQFSSFHKCVLLI